MQASGVCGCPIGYHFDAGLLFCQGEIAQALIDVLTARRRFSDTAALRPDSGNSRMWKLLSGSGIFCILSSGRQHYIISAGESVEHCSQQLWEHDL